MTPQSPSAPPPTEARGANLPPSSLLPRDVLLASAAERRPTTMEGSTHPPIRSTRPVCEPCDRSTRPTSPNPVGSASDGRMFISDDDLRLGHPSLRPEIEVCYLSRSEEMDTEEECLRHALLAVAPGGHPNIPDLPPRASCSSSPRNDPETRRCGPGADGDSGHDDHPDRDYPARPGCGGPTLHGFPCTPGVDDETAFTTGGSSSTHSRRAPTASGTGEPVTMEVASDQDKGIHAFPPGPPPPSSIAL
nr:unnamed protein product [Digitaria exilis]